MISFLTQDKLDKILPLNKETKEWFLIFQQVLPKYDINTLDRVVMFMAQCSHESNQFTVLKENLNYSKLGLLKVFPKYFNEANIGPYIRNPEKIANLVYANRMGNGNEASGDGWKFRGCGPIQTTGHENYDALATYLKITIEQLLVYMNTKQGQLESACFYWNEHQLNSFADTKNIESATKRINGGLIGLDERKKNYYFIEQILESK